MNGGVALCLDVDPSRVQRRLDTRYLDEVAPSLQDGLRRAREAAAWQGRALSVGVVANAAEALPALLAAGSRSRSSPTRPARTTPCTATSRPAWP